jgi:hypothetical protein
MHQQPASLNPTKPAPYTVVARACGVGEPRQSPLKAPAFKLFENAEEAWFWFVAAQVAQNEGVKARAGLADAPRPCEPVDILHVVDRLYRNRRLLRDHLFVLRHYGVRHMRPDKRRPKEMRAAQLWREAMKVLEESLIAKGIVKPVPRSALLDLLELPQ